MHTREVIDGDIKQCFQNTLGNMMIEGGNILWYDRNDNQ